MSIQALREHLGSLNKQANHLLAEKGARVWTAEDQGKFDGLMDEGDRVKAQIAATQRMLDSDAEKSFTDVPKVEGQATLRQQGMALFLRHGMSNLSAEQLAIVRNVMSTTTPSQGGYTVATEVAADLVDSLKAWGFMRAVAEQFTTANGGPLGYPTSDGTSETGELVAQNASASGADATFGTRDLQTYKFGSKIVTVPIELLQDATVDIEAMVNRRLRDRLGRVMNTYFTTGTGSAQPTGLVPASGVGKTGASGQVTTIVYDDLVDMVDSVDAAYLDFSGTKAGWMFSQTMRRVVRKIKDTTGRPIWTPSYDQGAMAGTPDMLLDHPVYLNNDMAAPAASAKSLAFGQLSRYMIRDALEVSLFRFDDSAYMSKGQVGFLGWARAGGNLLDLAAVKLYQHPAS
jgi:HK97 family phage major capsid protein